MSDGLHLPLPFEGNLKRHSDRADQGTRRLPPMANVDFNLTPFTVAWEVTRACALNCVHCRAEAQTRRDPRELSTEDARRVVDELVEVGKPLLIVTGGDPMMRPDLFDLIRYAYDSGLRVAFSPSATALVTRERLAQARDAGITRTHISLDGASPETHDAFRGMKGSFQRTTEILQDLMDLGMPLQIGTTVSRYNVRELDKIAQIVGRYRAVMWSVFFLVPTGRGEAADMISPQQHEDVFNWLYDLSQAAPFDVRTTAAMHYRRVVIQRRRQEMAQQEGGDHKAYANVSGAGFSFADGMGMSAKGVNDGNGFAFIDHLGNVCPSGFLQIPAGNLHQQSFVDIYRNARLFRTLRDYTQLKGKCGLCDYRDVCGGSRARAYAVTGDVMESEPYCTYVSPWAKEAIDRGEISMPRPAGDTAVPLRVI